MDKMITIASTCKNLLAYSVQRCKQTKTCIGIGVYRLDSSLTQSKPRLLCSSSQPRIGFYYTENPKALCQHQFVRCYAKSRDKKKSDKGQKKKVQVNEELLADVINVQTMKEQMQSAVEKLKDDFIKNLSLRSTSGSIETLPITFEGKDYILQDLAQVVRKNPKTVVINMSAFPQVIPTVLQAINKSGMNLNPQQDGTTVFIPIPKVTKEHRENLSKNAKGLFIKCRDSIKDVQNKFIKTVKTKEKDGLAKDTAVQICDYIEYMAAEHISGAEKIMEAKQQELLNEM